MKIKSNTGKFILSAVIVFTSCQLWAGKPGGSGGGDSAATEFLLIGHRIGQFAVKNRATSPVNGEKFMNTLLALEASFHPLYPREARIQFHDESVQDDKGVPKEALFDNKEGIIRHPRLDWKKKFESEKYVIVGTEVLGLNSQDRYVVSQWILQNWSEISRERVDFTPILATLIGESSDAQIPNHEFGTSVVTNTISWLKNLQHQGVIDGRSERGEDCFMYVGHYPVPHGTQANGIDLSLQAKTPPGYNPADIGKYSGRMTVIEGRVPKVFRADISKDTLHVVADYGRGFQWVPNWIYGSYQWIDRGIVETRVEINRRDKKYSVEIKSYSQNLSGEYRTKLKCEFPYR